MALLQTSAVAVLVAGSALYSAWRLTPARLHLRFLDLLGRFARDPSSGWLAKLRRATLAQLSGGGCGSCSSGIKTAVHGKPTQPH